jgi:hypothetical protein
VIKGGTVTAESLFNSCVVLEAEETCAIYEDEAADLNLTAAEKEHILATGNGALALMGGEHFLLVEGSGVGNHFTTFYFHGKECPLPLAMSVSGGTVLKLPDLLTPELSHAVNMIAPATLASLSRPMAYSKVSNPCISRAAPSCRCILLTMQTGAGNEPGPRCSQPFSGRCTAVP